MEQSQLAYNCLNQVQGILKSWEEHIFHLQKELTRKDIIINGDSTLITTYQKQLEQKKMEISYLCKLLSDDQLGQFQRYLEQNNNK